MIYNNPFQTEMEYTALLAYASEGSTIGQRMQQGADKPIPEYWEPWVSIERSSPGVLPRTLDEFVKQRESKLRELSPNEPNPGELIARSISPIRYSVGRKAKNCKKGKPCGGSCQSKKNVCFVGLSAEQKSLALKARKAMKGGQGGFSELPVTLSSPDIPDSLGLSFSKTYTMKTLNDELKALEDDNNRENLAKLRQFVVKEQIKTIIYDRDQRFTDKKLEKIRELKGVTAENDPYLKYYVKPPKKGAGGYMIVGEDHVVLRNNKWASDIGQTKATTKKDLETYEMKYKQDGRVGDNDLPNITGRNSMATQTFIHEVGHQVHYKSGLWDEFPSPSNNTSDPDILFDSVSRYGKTNTKEATAEAFVAWAIAPTELKAAHPAAYNWIETIVNKSLADG